MDGCEPFYRPAQLLPRNRFRATEVARYGLPRATKGARYVIRYEGCAPVDAGRCRPASRLGRLGAGGSPRTQARRAEPVVLGIALRLHASQVSGSPDRSRRAGRAGARPGAERHGGVRAALLDQEGRTALSARGGRPVMDAYGERI